MWFFQDGPVLPKFIDWESTYTGGQWLIDFYLYQATLGAETACLLMFNVGQPWDDPQEQKYRW
jgi:hypothetical protein